MPSIYEHFYKNRVALNVLAKDLKNAEEVYLAANKYVFIGLLSKDYPDTKQAIKNMKHFGAKLDDAISIGLGGGDSKQANAVAEIAKGYSAHHINQVFPYVGITRGLLSDGSRWINALVSPTGKIGYVNIATGPQSEATGQPADIPIKTAIALVRDMGGNALKYFPMKGLTFEEEYRAVATACGEENFALEPTGGIDLDNFEQILDIALKANVPHIIPHVYSSIIDSTTGITNVEDVKTLRDKMKKLVDQYV
ncbi:conserved hypothetical protein EF_0839/AHA_3917 [Gracilibacillus orientalis]|uniref:2-dehydro-3-deoxyphosphooctonate aldolase n=1 Tax=Gracilibacillus orientalis TaxID=334253 RepID=A0A1I4HYX1_9BACI|nr:KDGP aldolase [Gracilibacillus orientalis]SFL47027.1 conserved hypothetical protein EF_0839/AHA_3917 [Gracilibacillus orientalis]